MEETVVPHLWEIERLKFGVKNKNKNKVMNKMIGVKFPLWRSNEVHIIAPIKQLS